MLKSNYGEVLNEVQLIVKEEKYKLRKHLNKVGQIGIIFMMLITLIGFANAKQYDAMVLQSTEDFHTAIDISILLNSRLEIVPVERIMVGSAMVSEQQGEIEMKSVLQEKVTKAEIENIESEISEISLDSDVLVNTFGIEIVENEPGENKSETSEISLEETSISVSSMGMVIDTEIKGFPEYQNSYYLLAQIIECEAAKKREDRIYVGSVALNRGRSKYKSFAEVNTLREVLYQYDAYAYRTKILIQNGIVPSEESLDVARGLISGEIESLPEEVLYQMKYRPRASWARNIRDANLSGACQWYGIPNDYWQNCN